MIAGPPLPYFAAKAARCIEDGITGFGTGAPVLPWFGIFASWDDGLRAALRNGLMTALRVIGAVTTNARDVLFFVNLVEWVFRTIVTADSGLS